jgi:small-conductance mechanosensitive channel
VNRTRTKNKFALFFMATAIVVLAIYLIVRFDYALRELLRAQTAGSGSEADTIVGVLRLIFLAILAYLVVRALNSLIFGLMFRFRRGSEAPTLVRNVFSIVAFIGLFFLIFTSIFPKVNLGALFTTSAIFGVILGLALQDTLGNFFAGISTYRSSRGDYLACS